MKAYLLINLGTPADLSVKAVRKYLREFLMDKYVIDINPVARFFLVYGIISTFRSPKSFEAYEKIWMPEGSPLLVYGQRLIEKIKTKLDAPVAFAMRYGQPSIKSVVLKLYAEGIRELVVLPLYPQYAESSSRSSIEKVQSVMAQNKLDIKTSFIPYFYHQTAFINAWVEKIKKQLSEQSYDHVLFSYHGLPEHHMQKLDPTGSHCLVKNDCCSQVSSVNEKCYRAQCFATTQSLISTLGWKSSFYTTTFQSRLGKREWIKPYTDLVIEDLARKGVKNLLVVSPSFVADCLETIEEIGIRGKDSFIQNGGQNLHLLSSLNDDEAWAKALVNILQATF